MSEATSGRLEHDDSATAARAAFAARLPRRPLVPYALAAIIGIIADATVAWPFGAWMVASLVGLSTAYYAMRPCEPLSRGLLCVAMGTLAAGWHHWRTTVFSDHDIGTYATTGRQLCRLRGVIETRPMTRRISTEDAVLAPMTRASSSFYLTCAYIGAEEGGWLPACGRLTVAVSDGVDGLRRGDAVEIIGWLARPDRPHNPGEFDYAAYLRSLGIRATLTADGANSVTLIQRSSRWSPMLWRDELLDWSRREFAAHLPARQAAILEALVFGERSGLARDELAPFLESGTLHLLVVSGFHLVALGGAAWLLAGVLRLTLRRRALVVIALSLVYAWLTGGNSPVVRAAVLVTVFLGGYVLGRPTQPLNSLAGAALVVLALDPSELFRAGTQLSFLCVLTIQFVVRPLARILEITPSRAPPPPRWEVLRGRAVRWLVGSLAFSTAITLVSAPLTLHRYQLISPISILLTPMLTPPVSALLILAPLLLVCGLVFPWLAPAVAALNEICLTMITWAVTNVDGLPGAYVYAPALPGWWVVGFYLGLFLPWCWPAFHRPGWKYLFVNLTWQLVGLATLVRSGQREWEFTQLAVGHGICSVLRCPDGATLLYDCGSIRGPFVTERIVAPWLWSRGIGTIDAVLVSHADLDHFNGLLALAKRFRIGAVYVTPQFAAKREPAVAQVLRTLAQSGNSPRMIWAGDRLEAGGVTLEVLYPFAETVAADDNAVSLVIQCRFRDGTILLTGDLAGAGLNWLLAQPLPTTILVAPHHGSRSSNPPDLAARTRPRLVISSQGRRRTIDHPLAAFARLGSHVLRTDEDGAITCRLGSDGWLVDAFYSRRTFQLPSRRDDRSRD
jgi:competence protein ComEC